jgi:ribosomal protein L40E
MIYCIKCGSPNPDNASYCSTCGQDFVDDNHCPKCGKTLPPGAIYCSGCGSNLRELKNTAPLPTVPIYDPTKEDEDFQDAKQNYASDNYSADTNDSSSYASSPEKESSYSYAETSSSDSAKEDTSYRYSSFPDTEEEEEEKPKASPSSRKKTKRDRSEDYDDSYDEDDYDENGGFISKLIIILAIIIAAALLIFGFLSFSGKQNSSKKAEPVTASANSTQESSDKTDEAKEESDQVEVPDLSGMTYDQAKAALDDAGLGIRATYKNSETVAKDTIISQATAAGQKVDKDSKIHVDVSKGASLTSSSIADQSHSSGESNSQSDADQPADTTTTNQTQQSQSTGSNSSASTASNSNVDDGDLFPDIATTALSDAQLDTVSDPSTCRQAINELYAREGYIFNDSSIQAYFESKSWYSGVTNDMSAIQTKIYSNGNANYNLDALVNIKNANGWSW